MAEPATTPFVMYGARDAIKSGLAHIEEQVESIEQAVVRNSGLAFDLAKTLIESTCRTVLRERSVPVWSKYSNAHPYEKNHQHGPPPISLKLAQIPCHGFQTRIASESSLLLTDAIHEVGACRLTAF